MRINAELTRQDLEAIYELTYKYQMLKQEAALGDYGIPQQLPDNAYIAFEKIKQELNQKLEDSYYTLRSTFDQWLEHHVEQADQDLMEYAYDEIIGNVRGATDYNTLAQIVGEDELVIVMTETNPELAQFTTLEEIIDYTETLDPTAESALFKAIKTYFAESPNINEIANERYYQLQELNDYSGSAIGDVQNMLDRIETEWISSSLDDKIQIFQEALTTAHNNGSMAEYLLRHDGLADVNAVLFLSQLSNDPAYAAKWNQDLAKLLGYPVGSRLAPKQEWFSAHLKKAIRMIAALLRVPNLEN